MIEPSWDAVWQTSELSSRLGINFQMSPGSGLILTRRSFGGEQRKQKGISNHQMKLTLKDCGEVLGAADGLGMNHPNEVPGRETTRRRARQIMTLPISQRTKQLLANALLTPQAVWGIFNTGRPCTQAQLSEFTKCFRESVRGSENRGDRSSRPLQQVFLLGHTSDLSLVACSRFMNALNRWTLFRLKRGWLVPSLRASIPPVMQYVSSFLAEWGRRLDGWGSWSGPSGLFDVRNSKQRNLKAMHDLRTDWRLTQMQKCQESDRIDANCARRNHLNLTPVLLEKLRKVAKKTSVDGIAVICGGYGVKLLIDLETGRFVRCVLIVLWKSFLISNTCIGIVMPSMCLESVHLLKVL